MIQIGITQVSRLCTDKDLYTTSPSYLLIQIGISQFSQVLTDTDWYTTGLPLTDEDWYITWLPLTDTHRYITGLPTTYWYRLVCHSSPRYLLMQIGISQVSQVLTDTNWYIAGLQLFTDTNWHITCLPAIFWYCLVYHRSPNNLLIQTGIPQVCHLLIHAHYYNCNLIWRTVSRRVDELIS